MVLDVGTIIKDIETKWLKQILRQMMLKQKCHRNRNLIDPSSGRTFECISEIL